LRDLGSDPRRAPARLSSGSISSSSSPSTATKYVRVATQPRPGACRGEFGDACAPRTHKQHSPLTHPPHPPVPSHPRNPCCTHILYAWAIVALQHRRGTPEDLHGAPPLLPGRARGGRCHDGARALHTVLRRPPFKPPTNALYASEHFYNRGKGGIGWRERGRTRSCCFADSAAGVSAGPWSCRQLLWRRRPWRDGRGRARGARGAFRPPRARACRARRDAGSCSAAPAEGLPWRRGLRP